MKVTFLKSPQNNLKSQISYWFDYILGTRTYEFLNDFNGCGCRNLPKISLISQDAERSVNLLLDPKSLLSFQLVEIIAGTEGYPKKVAQFDHSIRFEPLDSIQSDLGPWDSLALLCRSINAGVKDQYQGGLRTRQPRAIVQTRRSNLDCSHSSTSCSTQPTLFGPS